MRDYKVQIVIPVYNAETTLKKCLDSLLNQTYIYWQAIIVDDKSKDGSLEVLREYAKSDPRFLIVASEVNQGSSATRNKALDMLDAEYTAFLDSDDYWEPDMLESLVSKAEQNDCDVVQCRFIYDFPGGNTLLPAGAFDKDVYLEGKGLRKIYRRMMTGINMNHVCMKLIRTSLLKDIRFNGELRTAEDLEFCVRLFENVKKYYFVNKAMYHYCRWENSLTGRGLPFKTKLNSNRYVSRVMLTKLDAWGIDNVFYRLLTVMRPYIIIVSKIFRMLREKLMTR